MSGSLLTAWAGHSPTFTAVDDSGVVAGDGAIRQHQYEWRCHILAGILPRLSAEIPIERLNTAFERCPVVLRAEHLDPQGILSKLPHPSDASGPAIPLYCITQAIIDRLRVDQGVHRLLHHSHVITIRGDSYRLAREAP